MSDLFKAQYNPDVLSCIANLSNDEVFTPPEVANQMLDLLPKEIWSDPNATFLDPACKSGVFLRECAKRLIEGQLPGYQLRVDEINEKKAEGEELDEADESYLLQLEVVLENIFKRQLYGMAITELTSLLSRRSVYCSKWPNGDWSVVKFDNPEGNIDYKRMSHKWYAKRCSICGASQEELDRPEDQESYAYEFIHINNPEEVFDVKFDVIVSNPPYQLNDGGGSGTSAVPIYHKFIEQALKLNPRYMTMITPSRWFSGGKGLDSFRDSMLHDDRLCEIHDYLEASDCFPGVQIKGGVSYFLWDREHHGNCLVYTHKGNYVSEPVARPLLEPGNDIFIRYNEAVDILQRIRSYNEESFEKLVSPRRPFGVSNSFKSTKTKSANDVTFFTNNGVCFAPASVIERNADWVKQHKVFISKAGSGSDSFPHQIIGKPFYGEPGTASAETFLVIGPFKDRTTCENVMSYIATKFFRFLILLKKPSQNAAKGVYEFVPMQDFSRPWDDESLYAKYGITEEQSAFIDTLIRPMELGGDDSK